MIEAFNIMQDRLTRMRLAGDPPDMHITPRIGHVGWLDFHRAAEAIAVGRAAAEKALDSITETIAATALNAAGAAESSPTATAIAARKWSGTRAAGSSNCSSTTMLAVALLVVVAAPIGGVPGTTQAV